MTAEPSRQYKQWPAGVYDTMAAMRERGRGVKAIIATIADRYGVTPAESTVHYHCKRLGADIPHRLQSKTPIVRARMRRGAAVRPWSKRDDRILLAMKAEGRRHCDIARAINRSSSSVHGRLLTLARRAARSEAAT